MRNLIEEMKRMNIEILGACEVRWPGSGTLRSDRYTVFFSGAPNNAHKNGVAVILEDRLAQAVKGFIPFSERVMLLQLHGSTANININLIQVYAPTADKDEHEIELFYEQVGEALSYTKKRDINIIMGDFNAKVGGVSTNKVVGRFGLGERNDRGDRLIQFCTDNDLVVHNTWFQLPKRRLYTWKSPQDGHNGRVVRNQIDFILTNQRFRNSVVSVKAYPGADIGSDHNLLCAKFRLRLKKLTPRSRGPKFNLNRLNSPTTVENLQGKINSGLSKLTTLEMTDCCTDDGWNKIKSAISNPSVELLTREKQHKRNGWITDEILELMGRRRFLKGRDAAQYNEINRLIRKKVKEAKEKHLEESCREIERLQRLHDDFHLHKQIKKTCGLLRKRPVNLLRDPSGKYILEPKDRCAVWTTYIRALFGDENRDEPEIHPEDPMAGPQILESEVKSAIRRARNCKAPGADDIPVEQLKLLDDESVRLLTALFNRVYQTGQIPSEWTRSIFVPLPKKCKPSGCGDYRLISLMSHTLKILLRVIQNRIQARCEEIISDAQFGFRGGLGTREALFCMNVLLQKCREFQKPVFVCFIDFEKAFDRVRHVRLIETLQRMEIEDRDILLLKNLYWNQSAIVRVDDNSETDCVPIERGVRQGCVLSPILFNVYSEMIFNDALQNRTEGVRIGEEIINNIRYADDTAILAESIEDLQQLVYAVDAACTRGGLAINIAKTKWMVVSHESPDRATLRVRGEELERVPHFKYLGAWLNETVDPDEEIRTRIEISRASFNRFRAVLCCRGLGMSVRLGVLRCYVWSSLLYGCETWTLKINTMNRLEAFEMWCYRRMLRVSWTEHVTNESVLQRLHKARELLEIIKRRKLEYFGHVLRGPKYRMLHTIIKGKFEGRRRIGRKKLSWLRNIKNWSGLSVEELFEIATDRERYKELVNRIA